MAITTLSVITVKIKKARTIRNSGFKILNNSRPQPTGIKELKNEI
jgi:hypothetical protein